MKRPTCSFFLVLSSLFFAWLTSSQTGAVTLNGNPGADNAVANAVLPFVTGTFGHNNGNQNMTITNHTEITNVEGEFESGLGSIGKVQ